MTSACMSRHLKALILDFWTEHAIPDRLPGPPVSNDTALVTLLEKNVLVGIGTADAALAAQTRFDLAWVSSNGLFRFIRLDTVLIYIWTSSRQRPNQMGVCHLRRR